jgi:hypothetical protein
VAHPGEAVSPAAAVADPTLNADESMVRAAMARHLENLSVTIGERHASKAWELADAADYVASELQGLGYAVERQGYEWGPTLAQNLAVTIAGGTRGDERILVAAHYDSPLGSPGVASAVSTAALLELARLMWGAKLERTLTLAFFALGTGPEGSGEARGARHFARKLGPAPPGSEVEVVAALVLENLLIADQPRELPVRVPVVSSPGGVKFEAVLAGSVNDELMVLSPTRWDGAESDARALHEQGIPCVVIGAGAAEGKGPGEASELALQQAARALLRLRYALGDWVSERPTNDAMVTPGAP